MDAAAFHRCVMGRVWDSGVQGEVFLPLSGAAEGEPERPIKCLRGSNRMEALRSQIDTLGLEDEEIPTPEDVGAYVSHLNERLTAEVRRTGKPILAATVRLRDHIMRSVDTTLQACTLPPTRSSYNVTILNNATERVAYRFWDLDTEDGVASLAARCEPAPFGDLTRKETVVDESVRRAQRFTPKEGRYTLLVHGETPKLPGHLRVNASRLKINMYGEGGFFAKHVDTPDSGDCVATLLVCLNPGAFEGGLFRIYDAAGRCATWDGSTVVHPDGETEAATAVFFYSDRPHEVEPVTGRTPRITLSVPLHVDYSSIAAATAVLRSDATLDKEVDMIACAARRAPFRTAIALTHGYPASLIRPETLKGADRAIYDAFVRSGVTFQLRAVMIRYEEEFRDDYGYDYNGEKDIGLARISVVDPTDVVRFFEAREGSGGGGGGEDSDGSGEGREDFDSDDAYDIADSARRERERPSKTRWRDRVMLFDMCRSPAPLVGRREASGWRTHFDYNYTGNEAEPFVFYGEYLRAAIVLD